MPRKDTDEPSILDEEELPIGREDIGFKTILLRAQDRIGMCINNISNPGKQMEYCHLVNHLHLLVNPKADDDYRKECAACKAQFRQWLKDYQRQRDNQKGRGRFYPIDEAETKVMINRAEFNKFTQIFGIINELINRKGWAIEEKGVDRAG